MKTILKKDGEGFRVGYPIYKEFHEDKIDKSYEGTLSLNIECKNYKEYDIYFILENNEN